MLIFALWSVLLAAATQVVEAQVTVYGQTPKAQLTATSTSGQAPMATLHAYDTTVLTPPSPPNPPITQLTFAIPRDAASMPGLSIPHTGSAFFGFSVEMSVITQILGKNSTHIFVPFLNLMSNIQERAGSVMIRMGGNTQEFAKFYDGQFNDGRVTHKEDSGSNQTTQTPAVMYTKDLFYMAANISSLLDVKWFLGLPFNDTSTFHLEMAEYGQSILGDNLLALQAGNEPDLYAAYVAAYAKHSKPWLNLNEQTVDMGRGLKDTVHTTTLESFTRCCRRWMPTLTSPSRTSLWGPASPSPSGPPSRFGILVSSPTSRTASTLLPSNGT
ncbi:hypothetical protein DFP72DRAFT_580338 [Ephemerocybe angulata]|uniref:Glycoside hydrolase family 79 protein n=1 Tax=Ephemerocybe angulata TaxID=980116 RepID=A0A8H6HL93_9AGAR|nr:hypothetical protein DFP72DRAFT_580338 [Tulosesus angulatus]